MSFCGSIRLASSGLLPCGECWHLPLLGFNSINGIKDIVMCVPWGGTRTLPQSCTIISWLLLPWLLILSLPGLATFWIWPSEPRDGYRGRTESLAVPRSPYRGLLAFNNKNVTTVIGRTSNHFQLGIAQMESIFVQSLIFFNMHLFIF